MYNGFTLTVIPIMGLYLLMTVYVHVMKVYKLSMGMPSFSDSCKIKYHDICIVIDAGHLPLRYLLITS